MDLPFFALPPHRPAPITPMSLVEKFLHVAAEFHPTRNEGLDVNTLTYGSHNKVWWLCSRGCSTPDCKTVHEWQASVNSRTRGAGCPFCCLRECCGCQSLLTKHPAIAIEWHPTANGDLRPDNVSYASNRKVAWKCHKGHVWTTTPGSRTNGKTNCPTCNVNKAEEVLYKWASKHCTGEQPIVKSYTKNHHIMVDPLTNKRRRLCPDMVIHFHNGKSAMIELDGPQHFESVAYFGGGPTDLYDQIRRDCTKNNWARDLGYSVLRISYQEYDRVEEILDDFLKDALKGQTFRCSNAALYNALRSVRSNE